MKDLITAAHYDAGRAAKTISKVIEQAVKDVAYFGVAQHATAALYLAANCQTALQNALDQLDAAAEQIAAREEALNGSKHAQ